MAFISSDHRNRVVCRAAAGVTAASLALAGWTVSTAPATSTTTAGAVCESDYSNFRNLNVARTWFDDGAGGCEDGGAGAFVSYIRVAYRAPDGDAKRRWKSAFGYNWIQVTASLDDGGRPGLVGRTVDLVGGGTREVNAACLVNVGPSTTYIAWPNKYGVGTT